MKLGDLGCSRIAEASMVVSMRDEQLWEGKKMQKGGEVARAIQDVSTEMETE